MGSLSAFQNYTSKPPWNDPSPGLYCAEKKNPTPSAFQTLILSCTPRLYCDTIATVANSSLQREATQRALLLKEIASSFATRKRTAQYSKLARMRLSYSHRIQAPTSRSVASLMSLFTLLRLRKCPWKSAARIPRPLSLSMAACAGVARRRAGVPSRRPRIRYQFSTGSPR